MKAKANRKILTYTLANDPVLDGDMFAIRQFNGVIIHQSELLVPHRKDYYLLVFSKSGNSRHWVDMTAYTTKEYAVYFLTPQQLTVKEESTPMWGTAIAFNQQFLAMQENAPLSQLPIIQNPANGHELLLTTEDVAFVEAILARIHEEHHLASEWKQGMISAYLNVLLTYLSRLYQVQFKSNVVSKDKTLLSKYRLEIERNFRDLQRVSDYASRLAVSAGHLSEVVKALTGKPAITYIHDRIILEARRLLVHSDDGLKEIAFELGFSDASYFSRFFKRETGTTPMAYRSSIREMYQ